MGLAAAVAAGAQLRGDALDGARSVVDRATAQLTPSRAARGATRSSM